MTNKAEIQHLLDKFMESKTSLDEERALKEYFTSNDDIPEEWTAFMALFRGFAKKRPAAVHERKRPLYPWAIAVAASVVCVLMLCFNNQEHNETQTATAQPSAPIPVKTTRSHLCSSATSLLKKNPCGRVQTATAQPSAPIPVKTTRSHLCSSATSLLKNNPCSTLHSALEQSDEQVMRDYLADNFMPLEEKEKLLYADEVIVSCVENATAEQECVNGIGKMVNDYEF